MNSLLSLRSRKPDCLLKTLSFFSRPEEYKKKVSEYVKKYASEEALRQQESSAVSSSSESSMSDFSEDEAQVRKSPFRTDKELSQFVLVLQMLPCFRIWSCNNELPSPPAGSARTDEEGSRKKVRAMLPVGSDRGGVASPKDMFCVSLLVQQEERGTELPPLPSPTEDLTK